MKNYLFFLTAGMAIFATSCSQDDPMTPLDGDFKNQINFTVTADNATRSESSYQNGTDINRFSVSAWLTQDSEDGKKVLPGYGSSNGSNSMYFINDVMTREAGDGVFNYQSSARYWPSSDLDCLDFFAIVDNDAPAWNGNGDFVFNNGSGPGLTGNLKQLPVNEMPDMLYAYSFDEKRPSVNVAQKNVSLQFRHAFAKVVISAEVRNENMRMCLTDMEIVGIHDEGKFNLPKKVGEGENVVTEPAYWTIGPGYTTIECPLVRGEYNEANPLILDMHEGCTSSMVLIGDPAYSKDPNNDLLVLPSSYSGRNSSTQQTYIQFKGYAYNIANKDSGFDADTDNLIYPKKEKGETLPEPATMIVPIEFNWEAGTVNYYHIVFDCGNGGSVTVNPNDPALIRIGYEVEVKPWTEGETVSPEEYKK